MKQEMCHNVTNETKDKIFQELRPKGHGHSDPKCVTLGNPKLYPHTKFEIP